MSYDKEFGQGRSQEQLSASWKILMVLFIVAGGCGAFFLDRWLREVFK